MALCTPPKWLPDSSRPAVKSGPWNRDAHQPPAPAPGGMKEVSSGHLVGFGPELGCPDESWLLLEERKEVLVSRLRQAESTSLPRWPEVSAPICVSRPFAFP